MLLVLVQTDPYQEMTPQCSRYIYTDHVEVDSLNIMELRLLCMAADRYMVRPLKTTAIDVVADMVTVSVLFIFMVVSRSMIIEQLKIFFLL
jgi:hypothetical protein